MTKKTCRFCGYSYDCDCVEKVKLVAERTIARFDGNLLAADSDLFEAWRDAQPGKAARIFDASRKIIADKAREAFSR